MMATARTGLLLRRGIRPAHGAADRPDADCSRELTRLDALCVLLAKSCAETRVLNPWAQRFAYLKTKSHRSGFEETVCQERLRPNNVCFIPASSGTPGFTREVIEDVYVLTAPSLDANGRTDGSTGAMPFRTRARIRQRDDKGG